MSYKIDYTQFNPALFSKVEVATKTSKPDAKNPNGVPYREIVPEYTYTQILPDGQEVQRVAELIFETPPLKCIGGVKIKPNQNGGKQASIFTSFDLSDPAQRAFAGPEPTSFFSKLTLAAKQMIVSQWGKAFPGQPFQSIETMGGSFSPILHQKTDSTTGMVIEGKNPTKFFSLTYYGEPGDSKHREAPFTLPLPPGDDTKILPEVIPWDILQHADFTVTAAVKFRRIYIGAKASVQLEVISGVISEIKPSSLVEIQRDTASRLGGDASLIERLHAQMAAIRGEAVKKSEDTPKAIETSTPTTIVTGAPSFTNQPPTMSAILSAAPVVNLTSSILPIPSGMSGLPIPLPTPTV